MKQTVEAISTRSVTASFLPDVVSERVFGNDFIADTVAAVTQNLTATVSSIQNTETQIEAVSNTALAGAQLVLDQVRSIEADSSLAFNTATNTVNVGHQSTFFPFSCVLVWRCRSLVHVARLNSGPSALCWVCHLIHDFPPPQRAMLFFLSILAGSCISFMTRSPSKF